MSQVPFEELRLRLLDALEAQAPSHVIDIVEVEVVGSAKAPTVRVRIDHEDEDAGAITLDEVSAQTQWINELIDEVDPFEGSFMLEVSSPGMARPLRKRRDFERFAGNDVRVTTTATEGRRKFTGKLCGIADDVVSLEVDGEAVNIPFDEIRTCKIKPNYDA